ncbi:MAG: hypothetical protein AB7Q29_02945 [Vicinamibacterales bacterium]
MRARDAVLRQIETAIAPLDAANLARIWTVPRMPASATRILLIAYAGGPPAAAVEGALTWSRDEQQPPHELHVLAFGDAARRVRRDLLSDGDRAGAFGDICRTLGLNRDDILFNTRTVHTLAISPPGIAPVEQLWQVLRGLCRSEHCAVTAVVQPEAALAAAMLHAVLQFAGRPADRVFVATPHASTRLSPIKRNRPAAADSYVEVPMLLSSTSSIDVESYMEQVERRRQERRRLAEPDPLTLCCRTRRLQIGENTIVLPPRQFFWVCALARLEGAILPLPAISHALQIHGGQISLQPSADPQLHRVLAILRQTFTLLFPRQVDEFGPTIHRACGPQPGLPSTISKINATLRAALGEAALRYLIEGGREHGGYNLRVDPPTVQIDVES